MWEEWAMTEEDTGFDSMKACERVAAMWLKLAETIENGIVSMVVDGDKPEAAIRWATCAEACFWKATGEADSHDVKDVLALSSEEL
jgi:hypothetical protein